MEPDVADKAAPEGEVGGGADFAADGESGRYEGGKRLLHSLVRQEVVFLEGT